MFALKHGDDLALESHVVGKENVLVVRILRLEVHIGRLVVRHESFDCALIANFCKDDVS